MKLALFLLIIISVFSFQNKKGYSTISINISNLKNKATTIRIAVYRRQDKFPDEKGFYKAFVCQYTGSGNLEYSITGLEPSDYAFAFYQDINNDNKLNTNIFGYPKEPFCFSNNVKPHFKAPNFDECKIKCTNASNAISVKMIQ